MKYYMFRPEFHADILSGVKNCTIREKQKVKAGETFSLRYWTGLPYRSKQGFLGEAVCVEAYPITIAPMFDDSKLFYTRPLSPTSLVWISRTDLAMCEGFKSPEAMDTFFRTTRKLPFHGFATLWSLTQKFRIDPCLECGKPVEPDWKLSAYCKACDAIVADSYFRDNAEASGRRDKAAFAEPDGCHKIQEES